MINKIIKTSHDIELSFSNNTFRKDKRNIEWLCADTTNSWLKNFWTHKLILNNNLNKEHLSIKTLHLNRKGNRAFAKYLLNFNEGN